MYKQRGFLSIQLYAAIGAAIVIGLLLVSLKLQSSRLAAVKAEYAGFVTHVEAMGKAAIERKKAKEKDDLAIKKGLDNENSNLRANLVATSKRLSDARAGSSFLPAASTTAPSPNVTADRAKLEAALREFDAEVSALTDRGDSLIVDLNTAKEWVKQTR